jgi:hypothetical protein
VNRSQRRVLRWFGLLRPAQRVELRWRMRDPRALPDALIIGAMKCGTSSLHGYLEQHPGVIAPLRKEVHYFDGADYARGEAWYRAHFGRAGAAGLNFESSPYYLCHPAVPGRVASLLPEAKLIVLLRDPVKRAYSHYWHERSKGREKLSFEDAIATEPGRVGDAALRLARGEIVRSEAHLRHTYLERGRYAEQLERWLRHFPRERLLCLRFEDFVRDPQRGLDESLRFLGLPAMHRPVQFEARNSRQYPPMAAATAERLREYFAPHNRALEALLGREFGWQGPA